MIKHPESRLDMYTAEEVATLLCMSVAEFGNYFERQRGAFTPGQDYDELALEDGSDPTCYFYADALPKLIDGNEG